MNFDPEGIMPNEYFYLSLSLIPLFIGFVAWITWRLS